MKKLQFLFKMGKRELTCTFYERCKDQLYDLTCCSNERDICEIKFNFCHLRLVTSAIFVQEMLFVNIFSIFTYISLAFLNTFGVTRIN